MALGVLFGDILQIVWQSNYHYQTEGTCSDANKNALKLTGVWLNISCRTQTKPKALV